MKVIFLGKHTGGNNNCLGINALQYLIQKLEPLPNSEIKCVVNSKDLLFNFCKNNNIDVTQDIDNYNLNNIDLVISYGWGKLIKNKLIEKPKIGCINFHPAPLPEWRGMGGVFNYALYEQVKEWGVSAHFVDKTFDTGDIIKVNRFKIDSSKHNIISLTKISHEKLLSLYKEVIEIILNNSSIPRFPQKEGRYISKKDLDQLREIKPTDTIEIIDKKIKACFCPPHHGAYITLKDKQYTIVNSEILNNIIQYEK